MFLWLRSIPVVQSQEDRERSMDSNTTHESQRSPDAAHTRRHSLLRRKLLETNMK